MDVGGGFLADGMMVTSDQTFLRFFPSRVSGAPDHILLRVADGISPDAVVTRLRAVLPPDIVKVQTTAEARAADLAFMATERPTGIIFGFGVFMGILVGLVIVYQVLSTDVADHLREYATFKAMGYDQTFFLGIVFEEALVLAVFGFIPGLIVSMGLYAGLVAVTGLPVVMVASRAVLVFVGTLVACSLSGAIATRRLGGRRPGGSVLMAQDAAITVTGLNHFFGVGEARKQAIWDLNLTIKRGSLTILMGPSGSGKTTVLTLMGCLRDVQEGQRELAWP